MNSSTCPPKTIDQAGFWLVASASGHVAHIVRYMGPDDWRCDCKAYAYRNKNCRHVRAAQGWFLLDFVGTWKDPAVISVAIPRKLKRRKAQPRMQNHDIET